MIKNFALIRIDHRDGCDLGTGSARCRDRRIPGFAGKRPLYDQVVSRYAFGKPGDGAADGRADAYRSHGGPKYNDELMFSTWLRSVRALSVRADRADCPMPRPAVPLNSEIRKV